MTRVFCRVIILQVDFQYQYDMYKLGLTLLCLTILGCQDSAKRSRDYATAADTTSYSNLTSPEQSLEVRHKYSYVKLNEDGSKVVGLLGSS